MRLERTIAVAAVVGGVLLACGALFAGLCGVGTYCLLFLSSTPLWLFSLLMMGGALLLPVVATVDLVRVCWISFRRRECQWSRLVLLLIPFLVLGSMPFTPDIFLLGYSHWATRHVDVAAIQSWLETLDDALYTTSHGDVDDFQGTLPDAVKKLRPYHMEFSSVQEGCRRVEFEWGNAMEHWGIIVETAGRKMPDRRSFIVPGGDLKRVRSVRPGLSVFVSG